MEHVAEPHKVSSNVERSTSREQLYPHMEAHNMKMRNDVMLCLGPGLVMRGKVHVLSFDNISSIWNSDPEPAKSEQGY